MQSDRPKRQKRANQNRITIIIEGAAKDDFDQWCSDRDLDMSTVMRGWIEHRDLIGVWIKGTVKR